MELQKYQRGGPNYPQAPWLLPRKSGVGDQMNKFADNMMAMMRENRQRNWELQKLNRAESIANQKSADALKLAYLNNIQAWSAPIYEGMLSNLEGMSPQEQQDYLLTSPEAVTFAKVNKFADLLSKDTDIDGARALADFSEHVSSNLDPDSFMNSFDKQNYYSDAYKVNKIIQEENLASKHYYKDPVTGEIKRDIGESIRRAEQIKEETKDYYVNRELFESGYGVGDDIPIEIRKAAEEGVRVSLMDEDQKKRYYIKKVFEDGVLSPEEIVELNFNGVDQKTIELLANQRGVAAGTPDTFGPFSSKFDAKNWQSHIKQQMAGQYGASNISNFHVSPYNGDFSFSVSVDDMSTDEFKKIIKNERIVHPSEADKSGSWFPWDKAGDATLFSQISQNDWEKLHGEFKEAERKLNITRSFGANYGAPSGRVSGISYGTSGATTIEDINNNPLSISDEIINDIEMDDDINFTSGTVYFDVGDGKKYTILEDAQDNLPEGQKITPKKMIKFSDPIGGTIKTIDKAGVVDMAGNHRWDWLKRKGIDTNADWNNLSIEQKEDLIVSYHEDNNPNSSFNARSYVTEQRAIIEKIKSGDLQLGENNGLYYITDGDKVDFLNEDHYTRLKAMQKEGGTTGVETTDVGAVSTRTAEIEKPLAETAEQRVFITETEAEIENLKSEIQNPRPRGVLINSIVAKNNEIENKIDRLEYRLGVSKNQLIKKEKDIKAAAETEKKAKSAISNKLSSLGVGETFQRGSRDKLITITKIDNDKFEFKLGSSNIMQPYVVTKDELLNMWDNLGFIPLPWTRPFKMNKMKKDPKVRKIWHYFDPNMDI